MRFLFFKFRNSQSKKLFCKHSLPAIPNRVFSSFGLSRRVWNFIFFFVTVAMHFSPANEQSHINRIFFSHKAFEWLFRPPTQKVRNLWVVKECDSVLTVIVRTKKVRFSHSLENLRWIVRLMKQFEVKSPSKAHSPKVEWERTVHQRFFNRKASLFLFLYYAR